MVYTTRTDVENYLRTTFDGTTSPTATTVDEWVVDADTEVDNITGTKWASTAHTEYFDLRQSTNKFLLSKYPLISVTSVEYNSGTEFDSTWTAFDNTRNVGDVIIADKCVQGGNKVKIVYNYGYSSVPSEVEHLATLLVVKRIVSSDDTANNAYSSVSVGGLSITSNLGVSRTVNLQNDIDEVVKRIGKYATVLK